MRSSEVAFTAAKISKIIEKKMLTTSKAKGEVSGQLLRAGQKSQQSHQLLVAHALCSSSMALVADKWRGDELSVKIGWDDSSPPVSPRKKCTPEHSKSAQRVKIHGFYVDNDAFVWRGPRKAIISKQGVTSRTGLYFFLALMMTPHLMMSIQDVTVWTANLSVAKEPEKSVKKRFY